MPRIPREDLRYLLDEAANGNRATSSPNTNPNSPTASGTSQDGRIPGASAIPSDGRNPLPPGDNGNSGYQPAYPRIPAANSPMASWGLMEIIDYGKIFYNEPAGDDVLGATAKSLEEAIRHAGQKGMVATAPMVMAALSVREFQEKTYIYQLATRSELVYCGCNRLLAVHGGAFIAPETIRDPKQEKNQSGALLVPRYYTDELLKGKTPDGGSIDIYSVEDVRKGRIADIFGRYAVRFSITEACRSYETKLQKKEYLDSGLVCALAGSQENAERFFERNCDSEGKIPLIGRKTVMVLHNIANKEGSRPHAWLANICGCSHSYFRLFTGLNDRVSFMAVNRG